MVKTETRQKLEGLIRELDEFQIPQIPDMRWLEEAEKTMR
jgi:hypothetical protein